MRKICAWLLVLTFLFSAVPAMASPAEPQLSAKTAILIEKDTGQILYAKNIHERRPPASITKIMTMLLIVEAIDKKKISLDDKVTASQTAQDMGGSQIFLATGEVMSVKDLMYSIGLASANDSCVAMAEHLYGSEEAFVEKMNDKAKQLKLKDTHFQDTNGLPAAGHYMSAYDIAQLSRYAYKYPLFTQLVSTKRYTLRGGKLKLNNTNKLLFSYPGANGVKTGHTEEAGFSLAGAAKRGSLQLISVVMGTSSEGLRTDETKRLLDYGFNNYKFEKIASKGDKDGKLSIAYGRTNSVDLILKDDARILIQKGQEENIRKKVVANKVVAPVKKGSVMGTLVVTSGGKELNHFALVAAKDVQRETLLQKLWRVTGEFIKKLFSKNKGK